MNHIKKFRHQSNLTQTELAQFCGITKAAISNYEQGTRTPRLKHLVLMVKTFNENGAECLLSDIYPPEEYKHAS